MPRRLLALLSLVMAPVLPAVPAQAAPAPPQRAAVGPAVTGRAAAGPAGAGPAAVESAVAQRTVVEPAVAQRTAVEPAVAQRAAVGRVAPARTWHVVKPGQTLSKIARYYGLRPPHVARWNQIGPPYRVVVDGTLRLTPPPAALPPWGARAETVTPESIGWDPRRRCPVPPSDLRRVWVRYVDFNGRPRAGFVVVHRTLVARTAAAFQALYRWRYRIMVMAPVPVNMPGLTDLSIVTSGYQCRPVAGTKTWSQHAYGLAIDLNPLQNPMVRGRYIDPPAGAGWLRRDVHRIGMVHGDGAARAFTRNGFHWGGRWRTLKDYQHFSPTNR